MLIFTAVFIICIAVAALLKKDRPQQKAILRQSVRVNALLHNIEVYDGTPKGQKKLEDIK